MKTFSFSAPINLSEEKKWFFAASSFEAIDSVLIIIDENNTTSITTQRFWTPDGGGEFFGKLNELLERRFEIDFELLGEEVEERGTRIEIDDRGYNLAGFDHSKKRYTCGFKRSKLEASRIYGL